MIRKTESQSVNLLAVQKDVLRRQTIARAFRMREDYLLLVIPILVAFIFFYIPMYGILIAFKNYRYIDGILRSPWNNFRWFRQFFGSPYFAQILRNTVLISVYRLIFGFPVPILFALLLNEIRKTSYKKIVQTVSYFPHFVSWVILGSIVVEILSPTRGPVAYLFVLLGLEPVNGLAFAPTFRGLLVVTGIWQGMGWGSIVYLAALSSIDPRLYETAAIDGANRFRMAVHITIPSLIPVMTILFILSLGSILNAGFQQILVLYNPLVYEVADIIDTYIYRVGILQREFGLTTAVGLFKNVIGLVLVFTSNIVIRRFSEYGIW